jgi:flagellar motor switch protein FliM
MAGGSVTGGAGADGIPGGSPDGVLRRKIRIVRAAADRGAAEGGGRAWRLALARAAHDEIGLALTVTAFADARRTLAELLDQPPDRALIGVLEGPGEALGMIALSPGLLAAVIEVQTTGRVATAAPPPRRPTRTDAAMAAGLIDRALAGLELALADAPDLVWAGGFRYASFLEDARPLALLLDDQSYRVLEAEVDIGDAGRTGTILLALPAVGRGQPRAAGQPAAADAALAQARDWAQRLGAVVMGVDSVLDATIARIRLPLAAVMVLRPGDSLPLGQASIDRIALEHSGGVPLAQGRLGQNRGRRALRLTQIEEPAAHGATETRVTPRPANPPAADPAPVARLA